MNSLKLVLLILIIFPVGYCNYHNVRVGTLRDRFKYVCDLVEGRIFLSGSQLKSWHKKCLKKGDDVSHEYSQTDVMVSELQRQLDQLELSHLNIFPPEQDKKLWQGVYRFTGISARAIEGRYVVYRVEGGSSAARNGLLPGDEILQLNGADILYVSQIETAEGEYLVRRGGQLLRFDIKTEEIKMDQSVKFKILEKGQALIEIPSFRGEFFKEDRWPAIVTEIMKFKKLAIDLRGNSGGNFVAMLRALSTFSCQPTLIGSLKKKGIERNEIGRIHEFENNLDQEYQMSLINSASTIRMRTFSGYGCYKGHVDILVDMETASVAEIFSDFLKETVNAKVFGVATAGRVVLGAWYGLDIIEKGYTISIPEANYFNFNGKSLEGEGVWPNQFLDYDLDLELKGVDSWLSQLGAKS